MKTYWWLSMPGRKAGRNVCIAMTGAAVLLIGFLLASALAPQARVERFVARHGEELEAALVSGEPLPDLAQVRDVSDWPGEAHPATEFYLFGAYHGCYYSPDDVPLAFQNVPVALSPVGKDTWTWTGEGDNHGTTRKIKDHWYYYHASF